MTEKQIESQILDWLNLQPDIFAFKINTVGIFHPVRKIYLKNKNPHVHRGTSDILAVFRGQFLALEVKTPRTKTHVSPEQQAFMERVKSVKGLALSVSSLQEVIDFVKKVRNPQEE